MVFQPWLVLLVLLVVLVGGCGRYEFRGRQDGQVDPPEAPDAPGCDVPGLVAWWPFDEGAGTETTDAAGRAYVGTLANGVGWAPGKLGNATVFDGNDDEIVIAEPADNSLDFGVRAFTVAAWVRAEPTGQAQTVVGKGGYGTSLPGYEVKVATTGVLLCAGSNGATREFHFADATPRIDDSNWHHVACVFARPDATYQVVDGVVDAAAPINLDVTATLPLQFGRTTTQPLRGAIDDVRIYDRALTAQDIATVMADCSR